MSNVDVHSRQRVVIEILTAEGSSPIVIHRLLISIYAEEAIDVSSVSAGSILLRAGNRHW